MSQEFFLFLKKNMNRGIHKPEILHVTDEQREKKNMEILMH